MEALSNRRRLDEANEDEVKITLDEGEKEQTLLLLDDVAARFRSAEQPEFLAEATVLAHELPRRVRRTLNDYRLFEPSAAVCVISGYPIDEERIGPTPAHWKERQRSCKPVREEMLLVLLGYAPYCRLDPYFMDPPEDPAAREAFDKLIRLIDSQIGDLMLDVGEICFIDNFKAVHGRRPFKARYDGTDRWLKRINITRDLRRSRTARPAPEARQLA
ncbi:MAG TPA: hypothetical protein VEW48_10300 [Thermoanaerobaculia bacterium]|nr:hypothetical protein [Thermoanaerobaculia bacterium]